jgi:hypothetical protein
LYRLSLILSVFFIIYSCEYINLKKNKNDEIVIASVGTSKLYKSDIKDIYNKELADQDSLIIINNYIENWAKRQIIIQKATLNLSEQQEEELDKLIKDYKNDLYINTYKDALVSQNLDTIISKQSIIDFYNSNQPIFKLKEAILKFKYVSFNSKSIKAKTIKSLFLKPNTKELDSLIYNKLQFNASQLNDSVWYNYKDIVGLDSFIENIEKEKLLTVDFFKEYTHNDNTYYFKVIDVKKYGEIAPIEKVTPVIKQMLLHKKRLAYINELDNKLIEEAIKNNTFKRY